MTACLIVDIDVIDPAGYDEYKQLAPTTVAGYSGKHPVQGLAARSMS